MKSVKEALSKTTPALAAIRKHHGLTAQLFVEGCVKHVSTLVKAGKRHDDRDIPAIASLILERYYYLKPEEVDLCFRRGIFGDYGKTYDVLDATVYLDWLSKYAEERFLEAEKLSRAKPNEHSSEINAIASSEVVTEILKSLPAVNKIEQPRPEPVRQPMSRLEAVIHRGYDRLKVVGAFKEYRGELVDFAMYYKKRLQKFARLTE